MGTILFVGIDVDDKAFHGCGFVAGAGEKEFKCSPTKAALTKKLLDWKREFGANEVRVCYETSYLDFSLQRFGSLTGGEKRAYMPFGELPHPLIRQIRLATPADFFYGTGKNRSLYRASFLT